MPLPSPIPRLLVTFATLLVLLGPLPLSRAAESENPPANTLTETEEAEGWKLLFDGHSTRGWHSFKRKSFPDRGWIVEDGCLRHVGRAGGGDIVSENLYTEFDFRWEWSLAPGANSGVKYFVATNRNSVIGHEYQMLNPPRSEAGKGATAGFYDVLAPTQVPDLRPPPAFNDSRILVQNNRVQHWLNGAMTLEYTLGSDDVKAAVARSKFRDVAGFGTCLPGHILLQDHGGEVRFRNLKIRDLSANQSPARSASAADPTTPTP